MHTPRRIGAPRGLPWLELSFAPSCSRPSRKSKQRTQRSAAPKLSFEFEKPSQVDGAREFGIRDQPTRGRSDREQQLVTLQVARCLYMLGASTLKSPGRLKKPKRVLSVEKPKFSEKCPAAKKKPYFAPRTHTPPLDPQTTPREKPSMSTAHASEEDPRDGVSGPLLPSLTQLPKSRRRTGPVHP